MATAHEIAVITNSCVKVPVDPSSGLLNTLHERELSSLSGTWQGKSGEYDGICGFNGDKWTLGQSHTEKEIIGPELDTLTDQEFYERLVSLKEEHRKTLALCENLYKDKLSQLRDGSTTESQFKGNAARVSVDQNYTLSPEHSMEKQVKNSKNYQVRDMSRKKPPMGPQKSGDTPSRSRSRSKKSAWMTRSVSPYSSQDEELYRARQSSDLEQFLSEDDQDVVNVSNHSKISEMWENFSVDDYAPFTKHRPRSASLSRMRTQYDSEKSVGTKKEWKHKITIPKPFSMTLREGSKEPKKTKAMIELEEQRERELRENEAECQKKFKAKPVPAHVYMPLYNEIMEEKEQKRRVVREHCKELLKSQERPFKFTKREEEKKVERRVRSGSLSDYDRKEKIKFHANPYPSHIFDTEVPNKIKEEEEYRKIRIQMRAEQLLKTASLPPTMASRGQDYVDGKSRQKLYAERAKKAGFTAEHKFKPNINPDMPDFDELHRKYMKEVAKKRAQREATVCKPFNLRTVTPRSTRDLQDERDGDRRPSSKTWSHHNGSARNLTYSKTLSTSMDAIPTKFTKSTELRMSANKEKLQRKIQSELQELEASRRKRLQEERLKKTVKEKAMANDSRTKDIQEREQKIKEKKETKRATEQQYKSFLNEMKERVQQKPFLFERIAQKNAVKAVERKFQETLTKAGVDEDLVLKKGEAATTSSYIGDDDMEFERGETNSRSRQHSTETSTKKYTADFENDENTQCEGEMGEEEA